MLRKNKGLPLLLLLMIVTANISATKLNYNHRYKCLYNTTNPKIYQSGNSIAFLKSFFKWYKTQFDYVDHHIYFVDMDLKNNSPYRINFKKTEEYLSILNSSGFFSKDYVIHARAYFKKIDSTLQKTKQNDGTVDGLDYDLILHSQEPDAILKNIAGIQLHVLNKPGNEAVIKMKTSFNRNTYYLYYLTKDGNKYLINKIDYLIDGKVQN